MPGTLYVLDQRGGMINCYDAKTGKAAYTKERLPKARGFTSSPWAANGKVTVTITTVRSERPRATLSTRTGPAGTRVGLQLPQRFPDSDAASG